jgi:hypothetical protein
MSIWRYSMTRMYTEKNIEEITQLYCYRIFSALDLITQLYFLSNVDK